MAWEMAITARIFSRKVLQTVVISKARVWIGSEFLKKMDFGVLMISSHRCNSYNPTDFVDGQLLPA